MTVDTDPVPVLISHVGKALIMAQASKNVSRSADNDVSRPWPQVLPPRKTAQQGRGQPSRPGSLDVNSDFITCL